MPGKVTSIVERIDSIYFLNLESRKNSFINDTTLQPIEEVSNKSMSQNFTSYLLVFALSIHAFFEGIAIGLQETYADIFYMSLAIFLHKWVESLSIGINLTKSNIDQMYIIRFILVFSLMTPLGIIIGILFSGISEILEAIFLSISAGIKNI